MALFRTKIAIGRVEERIEDLRRDLDTLERHSKNLRLEWSETYDKIQRLFGRIAKRTAIDNPPPGPPMVPDVPAGPVVDEVSAAILARRNLGKSA